MVTLTGLHGENAVWLAVEEFRHVREPVPIPHHLAVGQHASSRTWVQQKKPRHATLNLVVWLYYIDKNSVYERMFFYGAINIVEWPVSLLGLEEIQQQIWWFNECKYLKHIFWTADERSNRRKILAVSAQLKLLRGFESRSSLIFFFRLSFRNCLSCVLTARPYWGNVA